MKKSFKAIIAIVAVICIALGVFAACTKAPEKAGEGKKFIVATDTAFKPFEFRNEKDELVGIDVDIINAIAEDQGFEIELNSIGWDASIAACQSGQADGMIAGASITEKRVNDGWIFSDSYYTATQCAAVKAGSDVKSLQDLKGATVAVKNGTQGKEYAESLEKELELTLQVFEDSPTMYQAVAGGQCVACFEDTPIMKATIADGSVDLQVVEDSENDGSGYGFAVFSADKQELIDLFNAGLKNIKESGKYDEILAAYLGK